MAAKFLVAMILFAVASCSSSPPTDDPGDSPGAAFETYRSLLEARALSAESAVLTDDSRDLLSGGYSGGQQAREASVVSGVIDDAETVVSGDRAVVWFPGSEHASPYFLRRSPEGWRIDLASMAQYIGFDGQNRWYFRSTNHPYLFAFQ